MQFFIILLGCSAVYFFFLSAFSRAGKEYDKKKQRLRSVKGESESSKKTFLDFSIEEMIKKYRLKKKTRLREQHISGAKSPAKQNETDKMLLQADVPLSSRQFMLLRLMTGLVLGVIGFLPASKSGNASLTLLIPLAFMICGMLIPLKLVQAKINKKVQSYRDDLPDMMDLLVVSVEAGLGFDASLLRLYEKDKSPLMQEMIRGIQDVQRGMSKKEAYSNISARCNVKELTSFLNALIQAEQMGISIKSVLRVQSDNLREARRQRAEEKALKAPTKMLLPMVGFIFPVIFIVLLGPAVMNIMETLG